MNAQKRGDVGEVFVTCISDGRTNVPLSSADGEIDPDAEPMDKVARPPTTPPYHPTTLPPCHPTTLPPYHPSPTTYHPPRTTHHYSTHHHPTPPTTTPPTNPYSYRCVCHLRLLSHKPHSPPPHPTPPHSTTTTPPSTTPQGRVATLHTLHLPRLNNQGFDDNMEICSNISARVPNHQLVVPTADLFAAPPADSLEGGAEWCASLLPSPYHR